MKEGYIKLSDLNRSQFIQLKEALVTLEAEAEGRTPFMSELAYADELITDLEVYEYFSDTFFVEEDFI